MAKKRPQVKVKDAIKFLKRFNGNLPIFIAPSMLSIDPDREFIDDERAVKCVEIEGSDEGVTFGYPDN